MPDVNFGAADHVTSICKSGDGPFSDVPMPKGRQHESGNRGDIRTVLMRAVSVYASGQDTTHTGRVHFGPLDSTTDVLTIPKASSAQRTGLYGIGPYFQANPNSSARLRLAFVQPFYYGWGGAGSFHDGVGGTFGGSLAGTYRYAQAPAAPQILDFTSDTDGTNIWLDVRFQYLASYDDGDTPITGYRVQIATDADFTQNVRTLNSPDGSVRFMNPPTTTSSVTRYFARCIARNSVTDTVGTLGGSWSESLTTGARNNTSIGLINSAPGAWSAADQLIWNGTAWTPAEPLIWNGSAWVATGNLA